ncbi:AraC family transcriptional regulator [Zoogloea sp.]|uniref:AraC family transcriptional regulator n=1 Tax=Zoogloea sp. TaxID=49181 RepID=UPI0032207E67
MGVKLIRPAVDSPYCRETFIEEPGDLAEHVQRSNLFVPPGILSPGLDIYELHIVSPPGVPFVASAVQESAFLFFMGHEFSAEIWINGERRRTAQFKPGSVFCKPAGVETRLLVRNTDAVHALSLKVSEKYMEKTGARDQARLGHGDLPAFMSPSADFQTLRLSQSILEEMNNGIDAPILLENLALAQTHNALRRASSNPASAKVKITGFAPHVLRRVLDYMLVNLHEAISLDDLCHIAEVSISHFCTMFRQSTGIPPHQYLIQIRIKEAKRLLEHSPLSISEVGYRAGFGSPSQFSHAFRKAVRCTPQDYRKSRGAELVISIPSSNPLGMGLGSYASYQPGKAPAATHPKSPEHK